MTFTSEAYNVGVISLPAFDPELRILMMPYLLGDASSLPSFLGEWTDAILSLDCTFDGLDGTLAYVTIDQKRLQAGETLRRPGVHVDSEVLPFAHPNAPGPHGHRFKSGHPNGPGPSHPTPWTPLQPAFTHGMVVASNAYGCDAWLGEFEGTPGPTGDCAHLVDQCTDDKRIALKPNWAYWMNGSCVHESLPMTEPTIRQWLRVTIPAGDGTYEEYTKNPLGIAPAGPVLSRKEVLDYVSQ